MFTRMEVYVLLAVCLIGCDYYEVLRNKSKSKRGRARVRVKVRARVVRATGCRAKYV